MNNILHGLKAPEGKGYVVELHVDVSTSTPKFDMWLESQGFAHDPFVVFYPAGYTNHFTGRTRVPSKSLSSFMPCLRGLMETVIAEAQAHEARLYLEVEIVREKTHLDGDVGEMTDPLKNLVFSPSGVFGGARADVHVKFHAGGVSAEVRKYLLARGFYFVSTPSPKDIATLQTREYGEAKRVWEALVASPLPGCLEVQLEQKLHMLASCEGLAMPEVICVI